MRPQVKYYVFGLTFLILADTMQLVTPQILRLFVNRLDALGTRPVDLLPYVGYMAAVAVGTMVFRFLWRTLCFGASRRIEYGLRRKLFGHMTRLSANFFNHRKVGDLMAHATNDIQAVRMAFAMGVVQSVDSLFMIGATVILMINTISPSLSLWALLPLPVSAVIALFFGRTIHHRFVRVQAAFSDLTEDVQENFSGIRVIKAFGQEQSQTGQFLSRCEAYVRRNMELVRVWGLLDPLVDGIAGLSYAVATAYGGYLVVDGRLSLGALVAFLYYLALLHWPMMAAGWVINVAQRGGAAAQRLNTLYAEVPEIADAPDSVALQKPRGALRVEHLSFRYAPDLPEALHDVSFELQPGQTLGLIGRVGCGKSTLVQLLMRFYDPPAGTVFVDGQDVRGLKIESLRSAFGYVPQEAFLFSETIRGNVAFAVDEWQPEDVERAARIADVHDNIVDFAQGYDTLVGERGVTLSGGQKQRVSIARAIIQKPPVLVLDDSLSAVDTETEARILDALRRERSGHSNVIIAHRISAIRHADLILYLEDGRVAERGTHEELLELGGAYHDLYQRQLLEERITQRPGEEVGA